MYAINWFWREKKPRDIQEKSVSFIGGRDY